CAQGRSSTTRFCGVLAMRPSTSAAALRRRTCWHWEDFQAKDGKRSHRPHASQARLDRFRATSPQRDVARANNTWPNVSDDCPSPNKCSVRTVAWVLNLPVIPKGDYQEDNETCLIAHKTPEPINTLGIYGDAPVVWLFGPSSSNSTSICCS